MRSGAAPLVLGLRWGTQRVGGEAAAELPAPRWGLSLGSKAVLDEFFLATELVAAPLVPLPERRRLGREISRALSLYAARNWLENPRRYHPAPPLLEGGRQDDVGLPWARYRHLRFESGYAPHRGEPGRARWLAYEPNRTAHAWILEHRGAPRPWLVCVPGYRMGSPTVDFAGFRARWLHRELGLNLAIPVLPFHGPRRVGRRSGDGFLTGDFVDTLHAQAQAVWDVRRLLGWLRARRAARVGLHGLSLGGYTSALVAALEPDLDCVIVGIPPADFSRLLRSHLSPLGVSAARRLGFTLDRIEKLLRVVSPLALAPRVPRERRFLYAGLADRIASHDHAHELWLHWGRPRAAWYQGSHVSFVWEEEVRKLVLEALSACGMLRSAC